MRLLAWIAAMAGAALLAGTAGASLLPPPPPLPPPPAVTVPLPPLPKVTVPPVPAPPAPPVVTQAVSTATSAVSGSAPTGSVGSAASGAVPPVASGTASSSRSSSFSPSSSGSGTAFSSAPPSSATASSSGGSPASGPRPEQFRSSRKWIGTSGSRKRRTTTLTFVLRDAGRVVVTVEQVSPACVGIGHFVVAGRAGLNRVRFAGAVHGHRLPAGTYRISIRAVSGHVIRRVTLVVVDGSAPSQDKLRALQSADNCGGSDSATTSSTTTPSSTLKAPGPPATSPKKGAAEGLAPSGPGLHGILGSSIAKTARAVRPLLVALLALAIVLLGIASLPQAAVPDARMHELLARHRIEVAGLGVAALLAVALAFLMA